MGEYPPWWRPRHDVDLVNGVITHGFGSWAEIMTDEHYTFLTASQEYEARDQEADPLAWIPDGKVLSKRCRTVATALRRLIKRDKEAREGGLLPRMSKQESMAAGGYEDPDFFYGDVFAADFGVADGGGEADADGYEEPEDGQGRKRGGGKRKFKKGKKGMLQGMGKKSRRVETDDEGNELKATAMRIAMEAMASVDEAKAIKAEQMMDDEEMYLARQALRGPRGSRARREEEEEEADQEDEEEKEQERRRSAMEIAMEVFEGCTGAKAMGATRSYVRKNAATNGDVDDEETEDSGDEETDVEDNIILAAAVAYQMADVDSLPEAEAAAVKNVVASIAGVSNLAASIAAEVHAAVGRM
eukprot:gene20846-27679_t